MLKREDNPQYYDLIEAFKRRTGMAVLLNTSFNLHGDAIVESPSDAIKLFLSVIWIFCCSIMLRFLDMI